VRRGRCLSDSCFLLPVPHQRILLNMRNAPSESHPAIVAAAPGMPTVLRSSGFRPWHGIHVERHRCAPGPRLAQHVDRPVLILLCSASSHGEHRSLSGGFVPYRKEYGALTILPEGPATEIRLLSESELAYAAFDPGFLASVAEEMDTPLPEIHFRSGVHDASQATLLRLLLDSLVSDERGDVLYIESLTYALAARFLKSNGVAGERSRTASPVPSTWKLRRVQDYVENNLSLPLGLDQLAREAGFTRAHFARWFHVMTGQTPHAYVTQRRLKRACQMLPSSLPLTDIAAACGFASQSHMTQLFRGSFGLPPAALRRQLLR
jgi:AraC family transcriptional regulator